VIDILVGYITKQSPDRGHYPEWAKEWIKAAGRDGKSLDDLIRDTLLPYGFVYGRLPVKIDTDATPQATTEAERQALSGRDVYLDVIHPDSVTHWQRDDEGHYEWIKYRTQIEESGPLSPVSYRTRYVWMTGDGWWVCDEPQKGQQWTVVDSGVWGGERRRVQFPEARPPVTEVVIGDGESYMEDLGPLCALLYNLGSELRTLERGACFPILLWPQQGEDKQQSIVAGTLNALAYNDMQQHAPELMSFQNGPFAHYLERIDAEIGRLKEIGGTSTFFGAPETAAALLVKFGNTDRKLANLAKSLEDAEERILQTVAAWKGKQYEDDELRPRYPRTFEAMDLERLQKGLDTMDAVGAPRPVLGEVMRKIVLSLFPNADDVTTEKIESAISTWEQEDGADARADELSGYDSATPEVPELPDAETP
jgi:hypothetical protein